MKLNLASLKSTLAWPNYRRPSYDVEKVRDNTCKTPVWLHFGAGNMFRAFPAVLSQRLLAAGLTDSGVIVCEGYDDELIDRVYRAHDNLTVCATMHANGHIHREIVGSIAESLSLKKDTPRVRDIFCAPSLQMVTFTITQNAYRLRMINKDYRDDVQNDMEDGPENAATLLGRIAALCLDRCHACGQPIALVSLDNCDDNGDRLKAAVMGFIEAWHKRRLITNSDLTYMQTKVSFPTTMIDKTTPAPAESVAKALREDGMDDAAPFRTRLGTKAAVFVNTEAPQYLLIEDNFPNGRPPLDQLGVIITRRDIVEKAAKMKSCACLSPLDTALGVFGCLLGYRHVYEEMQDDSIAKLLVRLSRETRAVCEDPGVIDPASFLHEVLTMRYPNPFMPDTPQRNMVDISQKLAVRIGGPLKQYYNSKVPMHRICRLKALPLVIAGWLRYLMARDDNGQPMRLSPDLMMTELQSLLGGIYFGYTDFDDKTLYPLLSNARIFGMNLYEIGAAEKVVELFRELNSGEGAVRRLLEAYADQT